MTRLMPEEIYLGSSYRGPMGSAMRFSNKDERFENPRKLRTVMGFILPEWQRPFVWTDKQSISFIESCWRGIPIGTYSVNMKVGSQYDGYLIDGQQRMRTIEKYLDDEFPVFGYRWSEISEVDRRHWESMVMFPYYQIETDDEDYLRNYYNLMNFGGTAHQKGQEA